MNIQEKYPSLSYFLRCYFNQDFEVLFGDANATLTAYKETESIEEQREMKIEIEKLLALSLSDEELQDILLNQIDCEYYYPVEWSSSEAWLKHICGQLD
jgi:hypothetical protein